MEERTEEGQVLRLEGGNIWGVCISCGEVGHVAGSCPRHAWSENRKNGFWGKEGLGVGGSILDMKKGAII